MKLKIIRSTFLFLLLFITPAFAERSCITGNDCPPRPHQFDGSTCCKGKCCNAGIYTCTPEGCCLGDIFCGGVCLKNCAGVCCNGKCCNGVCCNEVCCPSGQTCLPNHVPPHTNECCPLNRVTGEGDCCQVNTVWAYDFNKEANACCSQLAIESGECQSIGGKVNKE